MPAASLGMLGHRPALSDADGYLLPGDDARRWYFQQVEPVQKKYRKSGLEHFIKFVRDLPVPSPKSIFARLEELGYRGQVEARRAVSLLAYRHVRRIKRVYLDGAKREQLLPKTNVLLAGPTGCGKTYLIELLFQQILRLPTVIIDITTYSETGYVGQDPSTILTAPAARRGRQPACWRRSASSAWTNSTRSRPGQNNAVFAGAGTTKDVTGMGVQRELLKMLESSEVVVPLEITHSTYGDHLVMSTADISFLAAGAFSGFHHLARSRGAGDRIGFGARPGRRPAADGIAVSFTTDEVENLGNFQAFGFLPELLARFGRFVPFEALDAATLMDILRTNVVDRLKREFEDEGFELIVDDDVLGHLVGQGLKRETGARGLVSILSRHLEDAAFESFAETDGGRVRVRLDGDEVKVQVEGSG